MIEPERRRHKRHACDLVCGIYDLTGGRNKTLGEGRLLEISLGGGLLSFPGQLHVGAFYALQFSESPARLLTRVWRAAGVSAKAPRLRYYGLVYDLSSEQESRLSALLDVIAGTEPL